MHKLSISKNAQAILGMGDEGFAVYWTHGFVVVTLSMLLITAVCILVPDRLTVPNSNNRRRVAAALVELDGRYTEMDAEALETPIRL